MEPGKRLAGGVVGRLRLERRHRLLDPLGVGHRLHHEVDGVETAIIALGPDSGKIAIRGFPREPALPDRVLVVPPDLLQPAIEGLRRVVAEDDGDSGVRVDHRDAAPHGSRAQNGSGTDFRDRRVPGEPRNFRHLPFAEEYVNDIPGAGLTGFWDPYNVCWSEELLALFAIDCGMLPRAMHSGTQVGVVSKAVAEQTGFPAGTPLCVGAGDQNSAITGAGIVNPGYCSVSLGTGGIVATYLDGPFRDPSKMNMFTNHTVPGKWQLEGYQAGAAGVYRWFRDEIAKLEKAYAHETKKDVYFFLNDLVAQTPPGAKGLIFLPYLASATTPRWNPKARGTLLGLTFAHDQGCLARAFMEGITLEIKDIFSSMYAAGLSINHVRILGGPTKSPLWNQLQADIYSRPVDTLKTKDAAALGAAICAGAGVGLFNDIREGVRAMVAVDKTYEPDPRNAALYDELYAIYCQAYEGLAGNGVFDALAKIQERF